MSAVNAIGRGVTNEPVLVVPVKKRYLWVIGMGILSLLSGCVSIRSTTNLKPPPDAATLSIRYKFKIEKIQYTMKGRSGGGCIPNVASKTPGGEKDTKPAASFTWDDEKWASELKKTGESRYPSIFSSNPNAHPLSVSIQVAPRDTIVATLAGEVLTLCVLGGVLPLPYKETSEFEVSPVLLLDEGATPVPLSKVQFQRKDVQWITILTPLALIPVPGSADTRDTISFPQMIQGSSFVPHAYALNVNSCVDAIVLALQSSEDDIRNVLAGNTPGVALTAP